MHHFGSRDPVRRRRQRHEPHAVGEVGSGGAPEPLSSNAFRRILADPDPVAAVQDANNTGTYDEVIVSTLPTHLSKWLRVDLPRKAAHATGLPVTHVVGSEAD